MKVARMVAPVREQVTDQVREAITTGRFVPGQRLIERELTELTGVSRPTVREALQQLAAEGLVTTGLGKGWTVVEPSRDELEDLFAVLAVVEGLAGRRFAERAEPSALTELRTSFEAVEAAGADPVRADLRFHEAILAGSGSETMTSIAVGLRSRVAVWWQASLLRPGRPRQSVDEMRRIVEAVERGDAEAVAEACAHHIQQVATAALEGLDGQGTGQG